MDKPMNKDLPRCPFCGNHPARISAGTATCNGMVDGKEVHNTISMRPECWNARASPPVSTDGLVERLRERNRREASHRNSAYDRFGMDNTPENVDPDVWQAADRIEQLTATLADRDATIERMRGGLNLMPDEIELFRLMRNVAPNPSKGQMAKAIAERIEQIRTAALDASATGMVK